MQSSDDRPIENRIALGKNGIDGFSFSVVGGIKRSPLDIEDRLRTHAHRRKSVACKSETLTGCSTAIQGRSSAVFP